MWALVLVDKPQNGSHDGGTSLGVFGLVKAKTWDAFNILNAIKDQGCHQVQEEFSDVLNQFREFGAVSLLEQGWWSCSQSDGFLLNK